MKLDLASRNWQGGGVWVEPGGVANFEGCNIHDNVADQVCSSFELPSNLFQRPYGTLRAPLFGLQGGGIAIYGTATLTNTNVYSNEARYVCSPSAFA